MKISNLNNISKEDLKLVGGKARGLAQMIDLGLRVPRGFVAIDCKGSPEEIAQIVTYYEENKLEKVAVRSSATLEDGGLFSSAGQYATVLNVSSQEDLIKAISECVKSVNDTNITAYRQNFNQEESKMNVVIQEMVDAQKAGVAFSVDPTTKKNEVLIECVEGLGENLVSGLMTAQQYYLAKENPIFKDEGFLSEKLIHEIWETLLYLEKTLNYPVDIEYAVAGEKVYYLQVRPITTLDDPEIDELNTPYEVSGDVITNHNVGEMLPEAITPLTISTVVYAIDWGLRRMLKKVGTVHKINDIPSEMLISHYYGHLFFNMRYIYRISKCVLGASKEAVDMGLCGKTLELDQVDNYPSKNKFTKALNGIKYASYMMGYKKAMKHIVGIENKIQFKTDSAKELYNSISDNIKYLNLVLEDHYITSSHSGAMSSAVFTFLSTDNPNKDEVKGVVASLLEDIDGIESVDILKSMQDICKACLQENPDIIHYNQEQLQDYLNNSTQDSKILYQKFLSKHGHRCIKESELRNPGWADDSQSLMSYLLSVMPTINNIKVKGDSQVNNLIAEVTSKYHGLKKKILGYLIKQSRLGCKNREYSKSKMILVIDKFKKAYATLAQLLVRDKLLPQADLIYFLKHDELGSLIFQNNASLLKKSEVRRRLFKEQMNLSFNHLSLGAPQPVIEENILVASGTTLQGSALSRGMVTGRARVVKSIEDARKIQLGEIMVSSYTDIGWSPYYSLISGLVTEVGSALSHGAVVAREYALPLVSNIKSATNKIKTGDLLFIDGTKGIVSVIESKN
ncbi:MAG: hypothetical protein LBV55_02825 [Acholeplasmatales bacterium]|jgi:pyruvate,water dikinase|nr:hypothetical protein [Acholeplasmatales bacterium]